MKTDRELLELAAKAAGIEYRRDIDGDVIEYFGGGLQLAFNGGKWSPLNDDGDALRLAVQLEIDIIHAFGTRTAVAQDTSGYSADGNSAYAATRRAIVRAAAEIGKTAI